MIDRDGWMKYCIWEHSDSLRDLYRKRCRKEIEEMTAHAQAVELLEPRVQPGDTVLDAGCGSGYLYHSLTARNLDVDYWGVDAAPSLIQIGREEMPAYGLSSDHLEVARLEDLDGAFDHVLCINVLSNIDNYHKPLERLMRMARKSVILRESLKNGSEYSYVKDRFLNDDVDLSVYVNHYDKGEVMGFLSRNGFSVELIIDRRTAGKAEEVIGYPHFWTFVVADRS